MRYICKNCGCELPDDAQFCTRCGTKVSAPRCPGCGRILPEDAAFCTFCGTRFAPEEPCAENTPENSVDSLPENPAAKPPTSPENPPESSSSRAEAAPASLSAQQACPSEPIPLPPNVSSDDAQPSAGTQTALSVPEPTGEGHPDPAADDAGNASPVPVPDVPALPADTEPPAFLLDGKSDIFQRLKQYEQNGDTRSEEYTRLRKQEKSAYFWCKLLVVLICAMINVIFYVLLGDYRIWVKFGMILASGMVFAPIYVVICSRLSQKCGVKTTTGLLSIFTDKSASQEEEKIADAGLNYCMDCIQKRHPRACRALEILMTIAGVLSVICAILCLSVGMGLWGSIRFGVLLWFELNFLIAVVWTWKGWLLIPLLLAVLLYLY